MKVRDLIDELAKEEGGVHEKNVAHTKDVLEAVISFHCGAGLDYELSPKEEAIFREGFKIGAKDNIQN